MKCVCGAENLNDARFCAGCGTALQASPSGDSAPKAPGKASRSRLLPMALVAVAVIGAPCAWWLIKPSAAAVKDIGLYPFESNGKAGLVDVTGTVVVEPTWDSVQLSAVNGKVVVFSEGLLPVAMGGRFGYVDTTGRIVITPQYATAGPFREGLAAVAMSGSGRPLWGFIDKEGRYVINPQFQTAQSFHDGLAAVGGDLGQGFVDRTGKFIIKPEPRQVNDFNEGLAPVRIGELWGFLDRSGKNQIRPQFRAVAGFSEGLSAVQLGDKWGYCDQDGKLAISPQFEYATSFRDGLAAVKVAGDTATIDKKGRFVLQPRQHPILGDALSLARLSPYLGVRSDAGFGLMTRTGKWVVEPSRAIELVDRIYGKVFQAHVGESLALVTWEGAILTGNYKGSTLAQAAEVIVRAKEEALDREAQAKVERAGSLFQQGQYQSAMVLCEEVLAVRPANVEAQKLKEQVAQTLSILGGN